MYRVFDIFNQAEKPELILCNPNKSQIYSLGYNYNFISNLRFNTLSEIQFDIAEKIDGEDVEPYPYVTIKRIVFVENFGYYEIINAPIDMSGVYNVKHVTAQSLEKKLIGTRLTGFGGTHKFYDVIDTESTLLGQIIALIPNWSIGTIDPLLWNIYRTFDAVDTNVYSFLMNDVESAYECIFEFDTINNTISAYSVDNATSETGIYLSFDNLIKNAKIDEVDEEITTKLSVYGAGNLDIRSVNPLGTASIYNFDFYKNTEWMSQGLIDSLNSWEDLIDFYQPTYATLIANIKSSQNELLGYQIELVDLQNEYLSLEGIQKTRIENNLDFSDVNILLAQKQLEIDSKQDQIDNVSAEITLFLEEVSSINDILSFDNNFTELELSELREFIFENTYQNENIIQTDTMTEEEKLDQAQELYDQGQSVLERLSTPRYTFSIESVNFVFIPDFDQFSDELELGSVVTIELPNEVTTTATVLEININYDSPNDFSITLSNRLRLDDSAFQFSDLFGQVNKTGSAVSFNKDDWDNWTSNYKDSVTTFINSALDASKNSVINAENQEILINQNGLRGRTYNSVTETYEDEQVWLTSSILAFTRDGWQTASTALGKVEVDGVPQYGLVADVVVGRLLAGNQLTIENEGGNFVLDSNGAVLTDASFSITKSDNKSRIILDPSDGILIQKNSGGTWIDQFSVDSSGNVIFSGTLSGANGTFSGTITATAGKIGGWNIDSTGIYDSLGNYIRSNGKVKLGALLIDGSTATFSGNIYANNLVGSVVDSQLATGIGAGKITYGTMSGYRVSGGRINGSAGYVDLDGSLMTLDGTSMLLDFSNRIDIQSSNISLISGGTVQVGNGSNILSLLGSLYINLYKGVSSYVYIGSSYTANRRMRFHEGILIEYSYL